MTHLSHEEVAQIVSNMVNDMSFSSTTFVDVITSQHPTLQQNTFRMVVDILQKWSEMGDNNYYDLRNEATVKGAKVMLEALKVSGEGYISIPHV